MRMTCVYSLQERPHELAFYDKSSDGPETGYLLPYPMESRSFWAAVENGEIPSITHEGYITSVHWGAMGYSPGFELTTDDGKIFQASRRGENFDKFVKGLRAKVRFLLLQTKSNGTTSPCLCEVHLEESPRRTERRAPGPTGVLERKTTQAAEVS